MYFISLEQICQPPIKGFQSVNNVVAKTIVGHKKKSPAESFYAWGWWYQSLAGKEKTRLSVHLFFFFFGGGGYCSGRAKTCCSAERTREDANSVNPNRHTTSLRGCERTAFSFSEKVSQQITCLTTFEAAYCQTNCAWTKRALILVQAARRCFVLCHSRCEVRQCSGGRGLRATVATKAASVYEAALALSPTQNRTVSEGEKADFCLCVCVCVGGSSSFWGQLRTTLLEAASDIWEKDDDQCYGVVLTRMSQDNLTRTKKREDWLS